MPKATPASHGWAYRVPGLRGSQVLPDIAVGSPFADLARGWAKIGFTLINLVAVAALVLVPLAALGPVHRDH
jgi:hypothetical protein